MKTITRRILIVATVLVCGFFIATVVANVVNATHKVDDNTTTVNVTMMNDCWDESFKGNVRIEQMFVTNVEYSDDDVYNVVTLEDTQGNEWMYENIDLFLYEDVLVLMCDNETPEDITDDVIIHCWVGME